MRNGPKSRLIRLLAAAIGGCAWLVLIVPIVIWERLDDWKWKAGKDEDLRRLRPF
jgi:hypothetical protein